MFDILHFSSETPPQRSALSLETTETCLRSASNDNVANGFVLVLDLDVTCHRYILLSVFIFSQRRAILHYALADCERRE